jgi:hypothetical protein
MASFVENNPQEQPETDNSIEPDKDNYENADGEELDLSDWKKVKKWCNVRARDRAPPSHYRTSLELAKSWYTLSKQAQDASIDERKAKATDDKREILLLVPGYAAKDAARKEKAPSQEPTVASRTRGGNTRADDRTTQRRGPRCAQQAQSEGVQLSSTTGLAHTAEQRQSKQAASIAPKRQTNHESYFKKVHRLEQSMLKIAAKLAWLIGKGNTKRPFGIKDYQLYVKMGNPYNGISSINGGRHRTNKRCIEEMQDKIIIVGQEQGSLALRKILPACT